MKVGPIDKQSEKLKGESIYGTFQLLIQFIIKDIQKKPRSFKIGIFSIFLVIGFLSAIQSIFSLSSIFFITIAENTAGDADIIFSPIPSENLTSDQSAGQNSLGTLGTLNLLNATEMDPICQQVTQLVGCSPRWLITGSLQHPTDDDNLTYEAFIIAIDHTKEESIGIGRRFKGGFINFDEVYVTASVMRGLGLQQGQEIQLNIDLVKTILLSPDILGLGDGSQSNIEGELARILDDLIRQQLGIETPDLNITVQALQDFGTFVRDLDSALDLNQQRDSVNEFLQTFLDSSNITLNVSALSQSIDFTQLAEAIANATDGLDPNLQINFGSISNLQDFIQYLGETLAPILVEALNFTQNFMVKMSVDAPKGKWADILGNVIVLDAQGIIQIAVNNVANALDIALGDQNVLQSNPLLQIQNVTLPQETIGEQIRSLSQGISLEQYSILQNVVITDRAKVYEDAESIQNSFIEISNNFYKKIGVYYPSLAAIPLALVINGLLILKLFLDNLVSSAVFLLVILSIILIYSLMISDVDEKTYEFGMLRALGLKKTALVLLLILEGLFFAIPGFCAGLLFAYLLNSAAAFIFFKDAEIITTYQLDITAIILGISLGIVIPMVSNYLPILRALSKTLRDSLDLYHRNAGEMFVNIIKLEKMGISPSQTISALTLVFMGVLCYYFAPQAFISQNIKLFLVIINIVLIMLILGLTILINLFQGFLQKGFIAILLFFIKKDRHLKKIIEKNMEGHRRRNEKTTLMYSIALAFLIFSGTGFNLQSASIADILASSIGADLKIQLPQAGRLRQYMEAYQREHPDQIQGYTFITPLIDDWPRMSQRYTLSPLSQFPKVRVRIVGIERNYLEATSLRFYIPTQFDDEIDFPELKDGQKDLVHGLFSRQGNIELNGNMDIREIVSNTQKLVNPLLDVNKQPDREINLIVPSGLEYEMSMGINTPALISFENIQYRGKVRGMAQKFPGFPFSGYRNVVFYAIILVSMEDYKYMIDNFYKNMFEDKELPRAPEVISFIDKIPADSSYNLPKKSMLIKFARPLGLYEKEKLMNGLRTKFNTERTTIIDVPGIIEAVNDAIVYLTLFSIVVGIVAIILSFFLILVSFIANIKENSWEFGVLRAVGLNKSQMSRIYIYEALALIVTSGLLGTIVGIIIAVTLTLQFLMFLELPFIFIFPYAMFFFTFFMGIAVSILGSYYSLSDFKNKSIGNIVKGLV